MNILFVDSLEPNPLVGGINRVVYTLGKYLEEYCHYQVFYACPHFENTALNKIIIKEENEYITIIRSFLIDNNIDIIVNMRPTFCRYQLFEAKKGLNCKYVVEYHNTPFYMRKDFTFSYKRLIHHEIKKRKIKDVIKLFLYPLWYFVYYNNMKSFYKQNYLYCDRYVLLSENYIKDFASELGIKEDSKLLAINNPLSYADFLPCDKIKEKENVVLIVSRLDNYKRVDMSLRVWKLVEEETNDWELKIVGSGPEEGCLMEMAKKMKLKRILFEGSQEPKKYYKQASIFISNSAIDGWPMTLMEAQQMGCIPIAMNSYKALPQIIDSGKNGLIIPNNNIKEFANQLLLLMNNREMRERMAANGIETCKRFTIDKIATKWVSLFEELKYQ